MPFMDDLSLQKSTPSTGSSAGSSYFGQPSQNTESAADTLSSIMPIFHQIKNRDLEDFKAKNQFMSDLDLRRNRIQSSFNPNGNADGSPNVVYKPSPADELAAKATEPITPFQQAGLNLDKQKLNQDAKTGQSKLELGQQKQDLDQQKNDQIHATKEQGLQNQSDEANKRLKLAYDQLQAHQNDAQATLAFHQAQQAASEAQHALALAQKDREISESQRLHDAQIKDMQDKLDAANNVSKTSEINADKTKDVTTTVRGSKNMPAKKRVPVIGPKGEKGTIEEGDTLPDGWKAGQ